MSNCITVNINPCIPIQPSTTPDAWLSALPVALNDQAAITYYQSLTPRKSGLLGYVVAQGSDVEPQGAMRRVMVPVISLLLLLCSVGLSAQAIVRTVGITYTNGTPTHTPSPQASWVALDTVSRSFFEYANGTWLNMGENLQSISGCAAPAYTPTKAQSSFVINACDSMYVYRSSAWRHVNKGGGGAGVTDGDKIDIRVTSGGTVWTVDTSAITAIKIASGAVTMPKIAQSGATTNQVIKWNGSAWAPGADAGGAPGGSNEQVQYNNAGAFGADQTLAYRQKTYRGYPARMFEIGDSTTNADRRLEGLIFRNKYGVPGTGWYRGQGWIPLTFQSPTQTSEATDFVFVHTPAINQVYPGAPGSGGNAPADSTRNEVMFWGFNPNNAQKANVPGIYYALEPSWYNGGQYWIEAHLQMDNPYFSDAGFVAAYPGTGTARRLFTTEIKNVKNPLLSTNVWNFTGDAFQLNRLKSNTGYFSVGGGTDGVNKNATMSLQLTNNNSFTVQGNGTDPAVFLGISGSGSKYADLNGLGNISLTGAGDNWTQSTRTWAVDKFEAYTHVSAPKIFFSAGLDKGFYMGNVRFLRSGTSEIDFFGGYGSGPTSGYSGSENYGIGYVAMTGLTTGTNNVGIGSFSLRNISTGANNTAIGSYAGYLCFNSYPSISGAVFIGKDAGNNNLDYTNKLIIDNSNTLTPLISGDFATNRIGINVLNSAPKFSLDVVGTDGILMPRGTTAQRRDTVGVIRYNTTSKLSEVCEDSSGVKVWRAITPRGNATPGGGTAQIQYNNAGAFDGADSIVIIETATARMGVGRINPTARLHVQGTGSTGSVDALRVDNSLGNSIFEVENGGKTIAVGQVQIGGALMPNNNAGTAGQVLVSQGSLTFPVWRTDTLNFMLAASDETSNLTTGTAKITFRAPHAMTLVGIRANVNTAPVGSTIIVDVNEAGTSIFSTRLSIDASEKTSVTAAVPPVFSDTAIANDAEITVDIDQIGSSTAGKGLKITLYYTK